MAKAYLVTGASRGLGLGLVARILELPDTYAVAAARNPAKSQGLQELLKKYEGRLFTVACDTSDGTSVEAAAAEVAKLIPDGLDYLVNNAGIADAAGPALQTDAGTLMDVYRTNTVGPYLCSRAFYALLKKKQTRVIVNISSRLGSITMKQQALGGSGASAIELEVANKFLAYCCSKAALNMETVVLANALKDEQFIIITMCPGWVATDMGSKNGSPPLDVETSTRAQMRLIQRLTPADTGKYFECMAGELAW